MGIDPRDLRSLVGTQDGIVVGARLRVHARRRCRVLGRGEYLVFGARYRAGDIAELKQRFVQPQIMVEPELWKLSFEEGELVCLIEKLHGLLDAFEGAVFAE